MNILWAASYFPYPPANGGKSRVYNLMKNLAPRHNMTLFAIDDGDYDPRRSSEYRAFCQTCVCVAAEPPVGSIAKIRQRLNPLPQIVTLATSPAGIHALETLLQQASFDVAVIEQLHMAEYMKIMQRHNIPCVLNCQNVEAALWRDFARYRPALKSRLTARLEVSKIEPYEIQMVRAANGCAAVSEQDRQTLMRLAQVPCELLPNSVDLEYFNWQGVRSLSHDGTWRVIMTGTMGYEPNLDAALYFLDDILPPLQQRHAQIATTFVGASPPANLQQRASSDGSVRITGLVEDVRPYVRANDLFIVPLRQGSGTRLKVLEAMAQGIPVISTTKGAEGIDAVHGEHIWLADTPRDFADGIAWLMEHPDLCAKLATQARALVATRYSWATTARQLEAYLTTMIADDSATTMKRPALLPRSKE